MINLFRTLFDRSYWRLGAVRSPKWSDVRNAYVRANPICAVCGSRKQLEVHHVQPFHIFPALELDPTNLISLCKPHHLFVGHLMSWPSCNKTVREDAAYFNNKIKNRP